VIGHEAAAGGHRGAAEGCRGLREAVRHRERSLHGRVSLGMVTCMETLIGASSLFHFDKNC
jgi:hypothetical protein